MGIIRREGAAAILSIPLLAICERTAELDLGETEFVAQTIRGARQALELFPAAGIEQIELSRSGGKRSECDADEPEHRRPFHEREKRSRIVFRNTASRSEGSASVWLRVMVVKSAKRMVKRDGAGVKARVAQALGCFLAEVAERGVQLLGVVRVLAERLIVRKGFCFGVHEEFVGVDAARFAIERRAPPAERFFQSLERQGLQLRNRFDSESLQARLR